MAVLVQKRRKDVKRMLIMGIPQGEIAEKIGLNLRTIERDVRAIRWEMQEKMKGMRDTTLMKQHEMLEFLLRQLFIDFSETKTKSERVIISKEIREIMKDWISTLQEIGVIEKSALKVEVDERKQFMAVVALLEKRDRDAAGNP